jgi:hypothetical protein
VLILPALLVGLTGLSCLRAALSHFSRKFSPAERSTVVPIPEYGVPMKRFFLALLLGISLVGIVSLASANAQASERKH